MKRAAYTAILFLMIQTLFSCGSENRKADSDKEIPVNEKTAEKAILNSLYLETLLSENISALTGKDFFVIGTEGLGYAFDEDRITYYLNPEDPDVLRIGPDPVISVSVAGDFNQWNPESRDWQMIKEDQSPYYTLTVEQSKTDMKLYKYVVNGVEWIEFTENYRNLGLNNEM
jgi:hypothetical protein